MSDLIAPRTTVLILSFNEAPNLARCLERLDWASRILLVDSGSTDETLEIASRYANVEVVHRPFDSFADQCNFGLGLVDTPWVLSLDADYELSEDLVREIQSLREETAQGYSTTFIYRIHGRALRGTLYPARTVLYRRQAARYRDEGHGHRVTVAGEVGTLAAPIYHDDRKPLLRWVDSQKRYAHIEADHLLAAPRDTLNRVDRLRLRAWPAPLLVFVYTLFWKGAFLDGWAGWYYTLQRTIAECLIALTLIDRRLAK
ncbi:glycosyltransferase family 2 protein [Labrys sp. La1]|uniref:glycosyltransferase family 2 protein n=1 Tax=Labrys sp. La1 TaxID=3404917 RepID=UPI003EC01589